MHSRLASPGTVTLVIALLGSLSSARSTPAQGGQIFPETGILGPAELHHAPTVDVPQPPGALLPQLPAHTELPLPIGTGTMPRPNNPAGGDRVESVLTAPEDLRFWKLRNVDLGSNSPRAPEPSACIARDTALITTNWTAGISDDNGHNFTFVNPATRFPSIDGGFCCDQRCIYDPSQDITIWYLQYSNSATTNRGSIRIAVAVGRDGLKNNQWHSYVFQPENFNQPTGRWLDFPDVALSDDYLYCASNVFDFGGGNQNSVVWRMSLAELRAAGGIGYSYFTRQSPGSTNLLGGTGTYRYAQGTGTTKYFATHVDTTTLRVIRWTDTPNSAFYNDRDVPAWLNGTRNAPSPNGINWMGFHDRRIQGAYQVASEYGFLWSCEEDPGNGRPFPFIRTARFRTSDNTLIQAEDIWNGSYGLGYPGCTTNSRGDKGVVMATGGASRHVRSVAFIVDQYQPNFFGQSWASFNAPTNSPAEARWGDYFTCNRHSAQPLTFVGTGAYIDTSGATQPQYLWFSRELDEPNWVTLDVSSTPVTGISITMDVVDRNGAGSGTTNFTRSMPPRQGYTLTAPATHTVGSSIYRFDRWVLNGIGQTIDDRTLTVPDIGVAVDTAEAQYRIQRTLNVQSTNPASGVAITVSVPDVGGNQNGTTSFSRTYKTGTSVTLTAPALAGSNPFKRWRINNIAQPLGQANVTFTVDLPAETAVADYYIHTAGSFTSFGTGCTGGNGQDVHTATGTPEIAFSPSYRLAGGRALSSTILVLGFSNTSWLGIPLPLPLGANAPGCSIYTELVLTVGAATNASGVAVVGVPIPNDINLIGNPFFTQFWTVDLFANPANLTFSNGIRTLIGGNE